MTPREAAKVLAAGRLGTSPKWDFERTSLRQVIQPEWKRDRNDRKRARKILRRHGAP